MKIIYALGVGHYTPICIELAIACGYTIGGLYHFCEGKTGVHDHGFSILGTFEDLFSKKSLKGMSFLLTMGDSKVRFNLYKQIIEKGGNVPTLIHPTAIVSKYASISPSGVLVFAFCDIQADSTIKEATIIGPYVNISHNNYINEGCFFAAKSIVGAYTTVGQCVFWGLGAISISGKVNNIGKNATIGAGALITKDVPSNVTVAGVPARIIKHE